MSNLSLTQQNLINQLIAEFIRHNASIEYRKFNSLLGIEDIIDEVHRKEKEIARIMAHNETVEKAMEPIIDEHYVALSRDINALGLHIERENLYSLVDGTRYQRIQIRTGEYDRSRDDITIKLILRGDAVSFEGKGCLPNQLTQLNPRLIYQWSDYYGSRSFEEMCEHEDLRRAIKKLYEQKQLKNK